MKLVMFLLILFFLYSSLQHEKNYLLKKLTCPNLSENERKITEKSYELLHCFRNIIRSSYDEVPYKHRNICFVTYEDRDFPYIKLHDQNLYEFCKLYNYTYIKKTKYEKGTIYWKKIFLLQEILNENKYDYVFWLDSDTVINKKHDTDFFISKYGEKDIYVGIDIAPLFAQNINAGIIGVKNSKIGKQFLLDCVQMYHEQYPYCIQDGKEQGGWSGVCYEQGVLNTVIKTKYKDNAFIDGSNQFIFHRTFSTQKPKHFLHLAATQNNIRERVFREYVLTQL